MAELITEIQNHPYDIRLAEDNPLFNFLTCAAAYAREFPEDLKSYIRNGDRQSLAEGIAKLVPRYEIDVRTTIAVTKIDGGIKVNALPQSVTAFINHRIRRGSTWSEVTRRTEELASKVAQKHGLELMAYPDNGTYPRSLITLELQDEKNPSAFTPIRTDISTPYRLIAGTTRAVFGDEFIVTSGLNMGNTDMKWYANVTDNIFRYAPMPAERASLHGLNECVDMKGHISMVEWFFTFLRNADETEFDL
ncbi:hypothetical protein H072_427 [Dactylellina haptotyla CBS 200.50]|uniref:Peptidase M20 dimerisation domain-containing protein n=1 Tax=Dactylellina haptotyla (strain CBS 200.50) TaxID=1284197 RepID=S8C1A1_DACHA|nr:hypothetical protein H072_427 [Dactylellina haptotyla CBS 200.50]